MLCLHIVKEQDFNIPARHLCKRVRDNCVVSILCSSVFFFALETFSYILGILFGLIFMLTWLLLDLA